MPQLSLYIDDATMETLRVSAQSEGLSMSRYASNLIRERAQRGGWPAGYWESVYGCLDDADFGFPARLTEAGMKAGMHVGVGDDDLLPELDDDCEWFEQV